LSSSSDIVSVLSLPANASLSSSGSLSALFEADSWLGAAATDEDGVLIVVCLQSHCHHSCWPSYEPAVRQHRLEGRGNPTNVSGKFVW